MLTDEEKRCLATFKAHADGTAPDCHVCKSLGGHAIKLYPADAKKIAACIKRLADARPALEIAKKARCDCTSESTCGRCDIVSLLGET